MTICGISPRFHGLSPSYGQVTHALLARPPLSSPKRTPEGLFQRFSFDLHVLGTPPAFVLSQDQTLVKIVLNQFTYELNFNRCLLAHITN